MTPTKDVAEHYTLDDLEQRIFAALRESGADPERLTVDDLAPVDEFHIRGRVATEELMGRAALTATDRVLDVGSGLGGTARYLASALGCNVVGVDLTEEYCRLATLLSDRVGLADKTEFRQGSALELPFADGRFDVAWTEHVQMNVADKHRFYGEIQRVLRPGGRLAFHDILAGNGGELHFPVPWAGDASISDLIDAERLQDLLAELGFEPLQWQDMSAASLDFFTELSAKLDAQDPTPMGIHLLMGADAKTKLQNVGRNLAEGRIRVVQAVLRRG